MKEYFQRLKTHPGLSVAFIMTLLIFIAVSTNESVKSLKDVFIFGSICSLFVWSIVLISNIKK